MSITRISFLKSLFQCLATSHPSVVLICSDTQCLYCWFVTESTTGLLSTFVCSKIEWQAPLEWHVWSNLRAMEALVRKTNLGDSVCIASRLDELAGGVELPRRAPSVGVDEQRSDFVGARRVNCRVRRAVVCIRLLQKYAHHTNKCQINPSIDSS